ncbi:hypothetical protein CAC42_3803 [Sphaceloma murrayae]|uniref:Uncharacterized protein n=1 Tax=Sphaceloma murrayae TaxID=2082308 RepID=A0A2K1QH88_9PEZI|nr:hypothetical protein CAC42_3803 [Sphaceloma murrayae]
MRLAADLVWDAAASTCAITFGRLLPTLEVPAIDLAGRTAVVTGANSGIGYSLALSLVSQGATVHLACRSISKGEDAVRRIVQTAGETTSKRIRVVELDTSSLESVRAFPARFRALHNGGIDILIHNAGITSTSADARVTAEGVGTIYATNFLGSHLLTSLLEDQLNEGARVLFTSSMAQYVANWNHLFRMPKMAPSEGESTTSVSDSGFYADTKSFQVGFARLLQERFDRKYPEKRLIAHSFSPGYTMTPILDKITALPFYIDPLFWILKAATALALPVDQGAATGLWLATTLDQNVVGQGMGGAYWDRCVRRKTSADMLSKETLDAAWRIWESDSDANWA